MKVIGCNEHHGCHHFTARMSCSASIHLATGGEGPELVEVPVSLTCCPGLGYSPRLPHMSNNRCCVPGRQGLWTVAGSLPPFRQLSHPT